MKRQVVLEYEDAVMTPGDIDDIQRRWLKTHGIGCASDRGLVEQAIRDVMRLIGHARALTAEDNRQRQRTASDKGWDLAVTENIKATAIGEDHSRIVRELAVLTDEVEVHTGDAVRTYWAKDDVLNAVHNL